MSATLTTTEVARTTPSALRLLGAELQDEFRGVRRDPTAWFFSVAMPVGFYALFSSLFGSEVADDGARVGTLMLANFGAFGVLLVATMNPGISLAEDRQRGWLRVKRTWAVPLPVSMAGKVVFAMPMIVIVLSLMTAVAFALGDLELAVGNWFVLLGALLVGALPFVFIGLTVGSLLGTNAAVAVLNAIVLPSAVVGGLWFPLEMLPDAVQSVAPFVPTYHLSQLAIGVVEGGEVVGHLLALLGASVVTALIAGVAYRRIRP